VFDRCAYERLRDARTRETHVRANAYVCGHARSAYAQRRSAREALEAREDVRRERTRGCGCVREHRLARVEVPRVHMSHCRITRRERDEERAGRGEGGAKSVRREERACEYVFVCDTRRGRVCMARKERGVEREGRGEGKTRRGRCEENARRVKEKGECVCVCLARRGRGEERACAYV